MEVLVTAHRPSSPLNGGVPMSLVRFNKISLSCRYFIAIVISVLNWPILHVAFKKYLMSSRIFFLLSLCFMSHANLRNGQVVMSNLRVKSPATLHDILMVGSHVEHVENRNLSV